MHGARPYPRLFAAATHGPWCLCAPQVKSGSKLRAGALVRLHAGDPGDNSLVNAFYGNMSRFAVEANSKILGSYEVITFYTRIKSVSGNTAT